MSSEPDVDVLIAGAGPTGLTLACELARRGVAARVVDRAAARSTWSKALAIHARTTEALEAMGIADRFLAAGARIRTFNAYAGADRLLQASFDGLDSPFPFVVVLPQSETERILEERLRELGGRLDREAEFVSFAQDEAGVTARLRDAAGGEGEVRARWLVGCDGAHSAVRHALGIEFEGASYEETFALADVRLETDLARDGVHSFLAPEGVLALFPFPEAGLWRVVADITGKTPAGAPRREPPLEEVQALLDARGPRGMRASDPRWASTFRFHRRLAARWRAGRVFLAGDAAHIHSPAGGQGMNTGMQDALNLAWKLALVARGRGREALLDSYEAERRPIAASTILATDRFVWLATLHNPLAQTVRNKLIPFLGGFEPLRHKVVRTMAELEVAYPTSPIVAEDRPPHLAFSEGPAPGARAPGRTTDRETRHRLLVFSRTRAGSDVGELMEKVLARAGDEVAVTLVFPHSPEHARYAPHGPAAYLIRPDGYVGYRAEPPDAAKIVAYLDTILT
ncbi:MAG TPA: FAD-dependent monooxygenase [Planctomycetota bacterium]|nr:FAD-dependent monooxygenase [Planctomycetota bacterium]